MATTTASDHNYIDEFLEPLEHTSEPTESFVPERMLWCKIIERTFDDILAIMVNCNIGIEEGIYDGDRTFYFHERIKLQHFVLSNHFEQICEHANVDHFKFFIKFTELLQLEN